MAGGLGVRCGGPGGRRLDCRHRGRAGSPHPAVDASFDCVPSGGHTLSELPAPLPSSFRPAPRDRPRARALISPYAGPAAEFASAWRISFRCRACRPGALCDTRRHHSEPTNGLGPVSLRDKQFPCHVRHIACFACDWHCDYRRTLLATGCECPPPTRPPRVGGFVLRLTGGLGTDAEWITRLDGGFEPCVRVGERLLEAGGSARRLGGGEARLAQCIARLRHHLRPRLLIDRRAA